MGRRSSRFGGSGITGCPVKAESASRCLMYTYSKAAFEYARESASGSPEGQVGIVRLAWGIDDCGNTFVGAEIGLAADA